MGRPLIGEDSSQLYDSPIRYLPNPPTAQHYIDVFTLHPFGRFFLNSLWVAAWSTVLTVTLAVLARTRSHD